MKISVNADRELELCEVYNPVVINTEAGAFGICERDGGIEILRGGVMVFACYTKPDDGLELPAPHFRQCVSRHDVLGLERRCEQATRHESDHCRTIGGKPHLWRNDGTTC